jgi:hypothetical protein
VSPLETLAGPASTFLVALGSLALFVRYPRNLFFPSLAFVNATSRLPEAVTLCVQLFFRRALNPASEEGSLLALLHLHNSTAGLAILCFFSLTLIFMSIAVVHESRWVPWKWPVALAMFGLLIPLQPLLVRVIAPAFS